MSADGGSTRRWITAATGALLVIALFVGLARLPRLPGDDVLPEPVPPPPPVEVAAAGEKDRALLEATIMHDQTPLFLPTERNVALKPLRPLEAGELRLARDGLKLAFAEQELALRIPSPTTVSEDPVKALLVDNPPAPLHGFGRGDGPIEPLPARGALVQVLSARTGEAMISQALPPAARPPTEKAWRPMEFTAVVDPAGLVGSLVVTERSDAEDVERYFRNYLAQTFRLGERLPPGFYRIVVGP